MNNPVRFLTVDHVLAIHRRMIEEFGGDPLLRDRGLLESAVMMPTARFDGKFLHEGIPAMAGTYLFHLCMNHAFLDGNKRAALASAEMFLLFNGMHLGASNDEVEELTLGVAESRIRKEQVLEFFQKHVVPDKRQ